MMDIRQTAEFGNWLRRLRDVRARERIAQRLDRLRQGLFGDAKSVGSGVVEMRIDYGPGYRVYLARRGREIVILLCGGDKSSQDRDIKRAQELNEAWRS